jgi:hypothetical protein
MTENNLLQMTKFCNDFHNNETVIFCKIDFILEEFRRIEKKKNKCVLIIANGDVTFNDNLFSRCPENVTHIFSTNTNCNSDKVTPLPIGVEIDMLPTRPGHGNINEGIFHKKKYLLNPELITTDKHINKLISNFRVGTNPTFRSQIKKICEESNHIDHYNEISFEDFASHVKSYLGVVSPRGNGIECIRTYETLYLGGVPIVVGSAQDYHLIYEKIYKNLPVVFISDQEKLYDFNFMSSEIKKVQKNSRDSLEYGYWVELINKEIKKL